MNDVINGRAATSRTGPPNVNIEYARRRGRRLGAETLIIIIITIVFRPCRSVTYRRSILIYTVLKIIGDN